MAPDSHSNGTQPKYLAQPKLDRIATMYTFDANCAAHQMLEHIANKWTVLIVYALSQGKKRYNKLKQQFEMILRITTKSKHECKLLLP